MVLVSSGHGLPLQDGKVYSGAGYYLNDLTVPVRALMKNGYEIAFASPKRADGTTRAGHVFAAYVSPTLEVMVTVDPVAMQKRLDPTTDLTLIDPFSK